ncbi:PTS-dependent dihydroxyacetone kinase phosphotransferase subunit DhaM [Micrococcaceae bacterium RIT802]|nr:PTS-dependent dihydroxyacetone kinase phosphotransferase subunit DhaM [Micrococcaceae bacterium RIT 802]
MTVGLVVVSHSAQLAAGVVELASQMAHDVALVAAGGMDDGSVGTSLDRIMAALDEADSGDGVVVLADLGSAVMTAEAAIEFLDRPAAACLADAPLVEGSVAAAVEAQGGADQAAVLHAAETAWSPAGSASPPGPSGPKAGGGAPAPLTSVFTLVNPLGLHARPAAALASELGALDVEIDVNGVDAQSVMMLMTLGAGQGAELHVSASGPEAQQALDVVRRAVESGFGES